ncbi:MAG: DHH family phosphoesterase [Oscillospiraceae bacterium]|nr:DHH family phosphoesterase [Oscillospiraceae bacterium]
MGKRIWWLRPMFLAPMALCVALAVFSLFVNIYLFYIEAALCIAMIVYVLVKLQSFQQDIHAFLQYMGDSLAPGQRETLDAFPLPIVVAGERGEIAWYNSLARQNVLMDEDLYGGSASDIVHGVNLENQAGEQALAVRYKDRLYTVYVAPSHTEGKTFYTYYFFDDTQLKKYMMEYKESRPSVAIMVIDNYEEIMQSAKESEKAQTIGELEYVIEQYVAEGNSLMRRLDRDRFLMVAEERHLRHMVEKRFDILDKVRAVSASDRIPCTLSMGIGRGAANLHEAEHMAQQALEMALGRGGDQVAIKTPGGYEFYGGISKGIEKRTKVKTRIVASALIELIQSSENVLIMGHKFADLDCLGSAVGLYRGVRLLGKPAAVVLNKAKNLAYPLYDRLMAGGYEDAFLEPETAMGLVGKRTLLIITDTHIPHILESEEIYRQCKSVVVVDHHRKMVNHIDNAVIFYHEPYASSASEMVTELLQYFGDKVKVGRLEAEALLSGIMLDTKNFVLRTGVRTFEAAAYLRKLGADTVEVRKLFANSMIPTSAKRGWSPRRRSTAAAPLPAAAPATILKSWRPRRRMSF